MPTFVLVHGAWHGGWCWGPVQKLLQERGHRVTAPDLPGHGQDGTDLSEVSLARYVERLEEVIEKEDEPVVLVGHSLGGLSISGVASALPERVSALVYLAAFVPQTMTPLVELQDRLALANAMLVDPLNGSADLEEDCIADLFYGDCTPEQQDWASKRLCSQALEPFFAKLAMDAEAWSRPSRHYIECLQDRAVPLELQREMHEPLGFEVHRLDTAHSPFLSAPESLVELLLQVAEG